MSKDIVYEETNDIQNISIEFKKAFEAALDNIDQDTGDQEDYDSEKNKGKD